jgi:hypothetical protein
MNLSEKQFKDLETVKFFIPKTYKELVITEEDIEHFFNYSERGLSPEGKSIGFEALIEGKRWRGIHMQMYEDGVLDGSMPYAVILEDMPRFVIDFMKKEMFKGIDSKIIEKVYETI